LGTMSRNGSVRRLTCDILEHLTCHIMCDRLNDSLKYGWTSFIKEAYWGAQSRRMPSPC
ncbi:hypothetical protein OS493_023022, partial [Desmophyllum pertusum]